LFHRLVLLIGLVLMTTVFSGCNSGYQETDSVAYILAVGVDKGSSTYQIALPTAVGSTTGSSGKSKEKTTETITIIAPTMANLRSLSKTFVSRTLDASHNKVYIVGEEMARAGLEDSLAPQVRFYEYRGSEFIIIVKGSADDFIRQNTPELETLPSKYYENLMSLSPGTGFFVRTTLHNFYYGMKNNGIAAYAPLAAVNRQIEESHKAPSEATKSTVEYDEPGIIPRTGGNSVELMGLAVFRGDKMVGTLNNKETRAFSIVKGFFKDAYLSVADPFDPKHSISIICWLKEKPKITVHLQDQHAVIDIQVTIEGSITGNKMGINYNLDENRFLLEESFSQDIRHDIEQMIKHTQEYGSDITGFGLYARKYFRTYQEYTDFDWVDTYSNADVHVNVNVVIRRTGLLYNTSPFIY